MADINVEPEGKGFAHFAKKTEFRYFNRSLDEYLGELFPDDQEPKRESEKAIIAPPRS